MRNVAHSTRNTRSTPLPFRTFTRWAIVVVAGLLTTWTLGMSNVIQLPLALVWILPFLSIVIGAISILWEGGLFDG